ncbi:hypothetical protein BIY29_14510 [Brenneria alni]|uniref:Uncharacterized protein n=1 Tax=Brenneria alni TaxID=71656 RepID=A0A421DLE7_9GAMM|nr:hypothetical protein [Brenneria alni]RLM20979.1 hypothetical protein BIY29_14510 [Brenneria alni]
MTVNPSNSIAEIKAKVISAATVVQGHQKSSTPHPVINIGQRIALASKKYWSAKYIPAIPAIPVSIEATLQHPSANNLKSLINQVGAGISSDNK